MRLPQGLARFNRYVTNPVQRLWAGRLPGYGIIEHMGRRTGKIYRTPVMMFETGDGFVVLLTYGPDRDWVKNLESGGGGHVIHRGQRVEVDTPRLVDVEGADDLGSGRAAIIGRRLRIDKALRLPRIDDQP